MLVLCTVIILLSGCVGIRQPALKIGAAGLDVSDESIALLSVRIANRFKPKYQPEISSGTLFQYTDDGRKFVTFRVDDAYKGVTDEYNEYLISFQIPPGQYKLASFYATFRNFIISGSYSVPLYKEFLIGPKQIAYLGHIDATILERKDDNSLRAGGIIPVIGQAVIGASNGTFVVTIEDNYENDMMVFQERFPYLSQYEIENMTLSPWVEPSEEDMK